MVIYLKKLLILLTLLLFLTGCGTNTSNDLNKDKLTTEVEYIGTQISKILHDLNNITLKNYELVSKKVKLSEESSSGGGSSGGDSGESSNQSSSGSQSSEEGNKSSQGSNEKSLSVTEMQNSSVLNIDTEDIDWETIIKDIENINTAWSIIMLDLYKENVSNDEIVAFSNNLNTTIINIKNKDKDSSLINLTNLYSYIPKFLNSIAADKHMQHIENTKYYIFIAYSEASQDNWDAVSENIINAETNFINLKNDMEYYKKNEFKINKTEILIKDIKNAISNKDKELFFLKYKNLIESLNTL